MSFITLDFETYYDKEYSLSKMTTEEYINDSRFEVIGVGIQVDDGEPKWFTGEDVVTEIANIDWENSALLCHNMMFDGAILAWQYGVIPGMYFDTLCMARALHGVDAGGSLKALAERYNIGEKGDEVINAMGKRRDGFTRPDLDKYGVYCCNDVDLTYKLFSKLQPFPNSELQLIDLTLRMYTQPELQIDDNLLVDKLNHIRLLKTELLAQLKQKLDLPIDDSEEEIRKRIVSNNKFAALLKDYGVEPPMKISKTTNKQTYALAKTDEGFIELQSHDDLRVQEMCRVRLGTKSTIEQSRIERFIHIGERNRGCLPVPLKYYGAHTGRWSGLDKVNLQNLPSRDRDKKTLKNSIVAPTGHVIVNSDSSQIEARVLAWLAGQDDVVQQFADKRDVYSEFASKIYKRDISKANPVERFVGKTCILGLGYGTGALKLQHTLKTSPPGADLKLVECEDIVKLYRDTNNLITGLWRRCDLALHHLVAWPKDKKEEYWLGRKGGIVVTPNGLRLPNGLHIRYPKLQVIDGGFTYSSRRGEIPIWGGSITENVVQALARIIIGEQMIELATRYKIVMTVHDAAVLVVPEHGLEDALAFINKTMSTPPVWAKGLPIACETKYGHSYGEC
jgi:DNA polymerase